MGTDPMRPSWLADLRRTPASQRPQAIAELPTCWHAALQGLVDGPEPDDALLRAEGLPPSTMAQPWPVELSRLLHQGGYAARLCGLDPQAVAALDPSLSRPPLAELLAEALTSGSIDDALGAVRTQEYLRLAGREADNAPLEEVGADLCTLVSACLHALLVELELADDVVVFGMGKLGGDELNFLSDIDLVFVHDDALGGDEGSGRHAVVQLHDRLRQLVRHLEGQGKWRPLFRVDLRLRPFGSRGPLSMSVTATEAYYERHGRAWERQVWLRARPLAGRIDLGELLLERLTPFVYRRSVGPEIFGEIEDMMRRARREATRLGADDDDVDLKLDEGGIRGVEFTVQALQLLHGGRNPSVRSTSTLPTLDRLLAAGLVSDREHRDLGDAYRWLRRVEHRVQLAEGQQTHRLPGDADTRSTIARRLGTTCEALTQELRAHRLAVSAVAQTMAGDDERGDVHAEDLAIAMDGGAPREDRCAALSRLGVHDPDETEARLEHLRTRPEGAFAARGAAQQGAENLLRACIDSSDPSAAIHRLVKLAASRPAHYGIWRSFAEPSPTGLDRLRLTAELLGASEPLSRGLIGFPPGRPTGPGKTSTPPDFLLGLLDSAFEPALPDIATLAADLRGQRADPRGLDATLLHFKHQQIVRVGLHDMGQRPDPLDVGRAVSDIADIVLRILLRDLAAQAPPGPPFDLAVLALGKHGMQAMDYGSDLDLMFVFEPVEGRHTHETQTAASRLAQRLMSRLDSRALGQRLYEVDMRLRPSGRQGLLVTSRSGFQRYHERHVAVWERLALLRLRPVAEIRVGEVGLVPPSIDTDDPAGSGTHMAAAIPGPLCEAVRAIVRQTLGWDASDTAHPTAQEVSSQTRTLRARIEAELARENREKGWFNAKTGRGGCLELELLVAALQLQHGPSHEPARKRGIVEAILGLASAGIVDPEEAHALCADYRFLRRLLNRLRMSPGRPSDDADRFSANSPRLVTLARRMGFPSRDDLMQRFVAARSGVRSAFDRHLAE